MNKVVLVLKSERKQPYSRSVELYFVKSKISSPIQYIIKI